MRTLKNKLITTVILSILINFSLSGQTYSNSTIYTPNGSSVGALILTSGEMSSYDKNYLQNYWEDYYDHRITFQNEATYSYNCHAYAWWISKGGSTVWVNTPGDDTFWNDDSYIEVSSQSEATTVSFGGPCWYYNQEYQEYVNLCDHSAITTGTTNTFISKWGPSPLFRHNVNDCPYDDQDLHFYVRPYITGPTLVCSSGADFTVNNLPSGATITWQCETSVLERVSEQGSNPCNFIATGSGNAWVEAVITTEEGQYTLSRVGCSAGSPTLLYLDGPTSIQEGQGDSYYAEKDVWNLNAQYYWYLIPTGYVTSPTNNNGNYITFYTQGTYTLEVSALNSCGASDPSYLEIEVSGYYRLVLSPNPSTALSTVSLQSTSGENSDIDPEWYLEVYNQGQQQKVFERNIKGKEFTLNTSNWKDGLYIVRARYKGKWLTGKLVVGKQ
jgi:hypothetical protein